MYKHINIKKIVPLLILLGNTFFCFSQSDYNIEKEVNIKIRTDAGVVLEEKKSSAVIFFTDNTQSLLKSEGVHFTPRQNRLNLISGFGIFVEPSNWAYNNESSNDKMTVYTSSCDFVCFVPGDLKAIKSKRQILYIRHQDGEQSYLVIAYDGENTLIVTPNL